MRIGIGGTSGEKPILPSADDIALARMFFARVQHMMEEQERAQIRAKISIAHRTPVLWGSQVMAPLVRYEEQRATMVRP